MRRGPRSGRLNRRFAARTLDAYLAAHPDHQPKVQIKVATMRGAQPLHIVTAAALFGPSDDGTEGRLFAAEWPPWVDARARTPAKYDPMTTNAGPATGGAGACIR